MKGRIFTFCALLALFGVSQKSTAQFQYDDQFTAEELINNFFSSGVLVEISNITFNGVAATDTVSPQLAYFNSGNSAGFNIDEGIVMTTGYALRAFDADTVPGFFFLDQNVNDPDMLSISNQGMLNDCAFIEFDVVINADAVAFNYVFASNEYPSFTCSVFNDAFGLFISGPGIDGPYSNGAKNIATIPDSEIPVAINTINSGMSSFPGNEINCENANPNWQEDSNYFVDNEDGDSSEVAFPGYTLNLEAYQDIIYGEQYHFKFGICDVSDGAWDSGVFLEAGSFEGRLINGVQEHLPNKLEIYPNPAADWIQLKSDALMGSNLQVYNIHGKLIKEQRLQAEENVRIDISNLDKGVYILQLSSNHELLAAQKLIVK